MAGAKPPLPGIMTGHDSPRGATGSKTPRKVQWMDTHEERPEDSTHALDEHGRDVRSLSLSLHAFRLQLIPFQYIAERLPDPHHGARAAPVRVAHRPTPHPLLPAAARRASPHQHRPPALESCACPLHGLGQRVLRPTVTDPRGPGQLHRSPGGCRSPRHVGPRGLFPPRREPGRARAHDAQGVLQQLWR
jgi:hypothetical protein